MSNTNKGVPEGKALKPLRVVWTESPLASLSFSQSFHLLHFWLTTSSLLYVYLLYSVFHVMSPFSSHSRLFFSTSSLDSSAILTSCRGIRAFLEIAKLARYFPESSAPPPLPPSSLLLLLLLLGPDLPPQQLGSLFSTSIKPKQTLFVLQSSLKGGTKKPIWSRIKRRR